MKFAAGASLALGGLVLAGMVAGIATARPAPIAPPSAVSSTPSATSAPSVRWTPPPSSTTARPPATWDPAPVYIEQHDDGDGESRFCRRRWWC